MENPEALKREIKALAFDQYGTIVDMQKGLTEAVTPFLKRKAWDGSPNTFVTPDPLRELHDRRPLRSRPHALQADRASRGLLRHGPQRHRLRARRGALARRRDREVETVSLRRRGAREATGPGIQTHDPLDGDRDMLQTAGPQIGFRFDHVILLQEAGYFKPHWKTYAKATEIIGLDRSSILFVANHAFDCIGAKS